MMKQILTDTLLGYHETHPITCPFINPLIFQGKTCTRVFDVALYQNPSDLTIYSYDLFEAVDNLKKWVSDVIASYENLPDEVKSLKADLEIDVMIDNIKEMYHFSIDVDSQERYINQIINRWEEAHNKYNDLNDKIESKSRELDVAESMLDIDVNDDDVKNYRLSQKTTAANELLALENELLILQNEFDDDISAQFEIETETYSQTLETLRTRNDNMRVETYALIECLTINFKNELNIEQPNDYLTKRFGIKDSLSGIKTLNIGLLYNNSAFNVNSLDEYETNDNEYGKQYFMKLADDLYSRNILTHADKSEFKEKINPFMLLKDAYFEKYGISKAESRTPDFQKKLLFNKLKEYGYQVVRFYETIDDYKKSKDNFKTLELKDWGNTLKQKKTIKPV